MSKKNLRISLLFPSQDSCDMNLSARTRPAIDRVNSLRASVASSYNDATFAGRIAASRSGPCGEAIASLNSVGRDSFGGFFALNFHTRPLPCRLYDLSTQSLMYSDPSGAIA